MNHKNIRKLLIKSKVDLLAKYNAEVETLNSFLKSVGSGEIRMPFKDMHFIVEWAVGVKSASETYGAFTKLDIEKAVKNKLDKTVNFLNDVAPAFDYVTKCRIENFNAILLNDIKLLYIRYLRIAKQYFKELSNIEKTTPEVIYVLNHFSTDRSYIKLITMDQALKIIKSKKMMEKGHYIMHNSIIFEERGEENRLTLTKSFILPDKMLTELKDRCNIKDRVDTDKLIWGENLINRIKVAETINGGI